MAPHDFPVFTINMQMQWYCESHSTYVTCNDIVFVCQAVKQTQLKNNWTHIEATNCAFKKALSYLLWLEYCE